MGMRNIILLSLNIVGLHLYLYVCFNFFSYRLHLFLLTVLILTQILNINDYTLPTRVYFPAFQIFFAALIFVVEEFEKEKKRKEIDYKVNNQEVQVLRNGKITIIKSFQLLVGDIVKVRQD